MIYSINYDLHRPHQDYSGLYGAIKSCGDWWHYLGSTWLVSTGLSANDIWDRLRPHIDDDDRILVIGATKDNRGWLPRDAWDWISQREAALA